MDQPRSRNLRKHRQSTQRAYYLVTTCCHSRQPIFSSNRFCEVLINEIHSSDHDGLTDTYAFVVMPDHLHWLFTLKTPLALSMVMRRVKARTALYLSRLGLCARPIWQPGFHDRVVRSDEELVTFGDYIVHNPVRAGLVERPNQYPYWDVLWRRRANRG